MAQNIMNEATINYVFSGGSQSQTGSSNVSTVTLKDEASLSLTKAAETTTFVPGGTVTYTVTITNNGTSWFSGVRITDDLSGSGYLTYVANSAWLFYNGQNVRPEIASTSPLVFTLSPLSVGQSMVLTYTCKIPTSLPLSVDTIKNSVEGTGYTSTTSVKGYASAEITRSSTSELIIDKTATKSSVAVGEIFSYNITLTNQSTTEATVSSLVDNLPTNFVLSSVKSKIGSNAQTILSSSDYTLDSSNKITIPSSSSSFVLTVPAATSSGVGTTVVTITGYLTK